MFYNASISDEGIFIIKNQEDEKNLETNMKQNRDANSKINLQPNPLYKLSAMSSRESNNPNKDYK